MFGLNDKRPREEDDDEDTAIVDLDGSLIRERKRSRPLPFRTLPSKFQKQGSTGYLSRCPPSILTPTDSTDEDDEDDNLDNENVHTACNGLGSLHGIRPPPLNMNNAMELDTCDDALPLDNNNSNSDNMSSWPVDGNIHGSVRPSPIPHGLVNRSLNINEDLITTPVYDHSTMNNMNMPAGITMGFKPMPIDDINTEKIEETDVWEHQSLPSPVSEDKCTLKSSDDNNALSAANTPIWTTNTREETRRPGNDVTKSRSSSSKGKLMLSMGFRADCDKCRQKIPGHYSHIISS